MLVYVGSFQGMKYMSKIREDTQLAKMQRLEKLAGFGNVQMVETNVPIPGPDEVLVRVHRSLISRGSELFARYVKEEAMPARIMGYSDAGEVVETGDTVKGITVGQRVKVLAPHAQFVTKTATDGLAVFPIPEGLSYDSATFMALAAGGVAWSRSTPINPGDTVVVLGQGLVGNLYAQAVRDRQPGKVIVVDATELRCRIARECGADEVINVSETDSVEAIMDLTRGRGADVLVECVGGTSGIKSFEQAQRMIKSDGTIHMIAKYQAGDGVRGSGLLPLDSSVMQGKQIIFGFWKSPGGPNTRDLTDTADMLMDGRIRVDPLITHRMPWQDTPDAYHMLYKDLTSALGVILEWDH